ncbi:MAG: DNRLRE domain-containing protein [Phycisphaerales bacterium]|nr:DNRLRE domain-containing protein [Phycisphaerales bacterium]
MPAQRVLPRRVLAQRVLAQRVLQERVQMQIARLFLVLSAAGALSGVPALAGTLTLNSGRDNTLFESTFGDISNGAGEYLFAGFTGADTRRRALIRFDFDPAQLPDDAVITSVTLRLSMSRTISATEAVSLHRVSRSWGEGGSDAPLEEGGGTVAEAGDATWLHAFYPDVSWSAPGGDFDAAPLATALVIGNGYYDWSSAALVGEVESWRADPSVNHGWMLIGNEEQTATAKRFDSFQHGDPAVRPVLIVSYVPEPASAPCAVIAALIAARCARVRAAGWPFADTAMNPHPNPYRHPAVGGQERP